MPIPQPAITALLDQWSAAARDHFTHYGVDLDDPSTQRALGIAYLWFEQHRHAPTPACLALGAALGY